MTAIVKNQTGRPANSNSTTAELTGLLSAVANVRILALPGVIESRAEGRSLIDLELGELQTDLLRFHAITTAMIDVDFQLAAIARLARPVDDLPLVVLLRFPSLRCLRLLPFSLLGRHGRLFDELGTGEFFELLLVLSGSLVKFDRL